MNDLIFSFSFLPILLANLLLSIAPFTRVISRKRMGVILCTGTVLLACAWGVYYYAAVNGCATFALIKHIFLIYSLLTTVVSVAVVPHYRREWICSAALATLFHYLVSAIVAYLVDFFYGWSGMESYMRMGMIACLLIVLCYFPVRHMIVRTIRPFLTCKVNTYWRSIYLIPVTMLIGCYFVLPGNAHMETVGQLFSRLSMVASAFLICNSISADHAYMQERQEMEKQLQQQKIYYTSMTADLESARRQRHDLKHHLAAIGHYIETDNKEGLRKYCAALEKQDDMHISLPYSGNSAVDGVVYHYMQRCAEQQIRFSFQGVIHSGNIADTDICVLLGNALDNALAGCLTVSNDRFVHITVQSEKQLLSVLIRNRFDGSVRVTDSGKLLSRKRGNRTGVGMRSMETICEHYGGALEQSWTDDTFTLCILLPLDGEK